jgi:AAA15 family ATPase/GTPase
MRINSIQLSWFRGAADSAALELRGKSMVVYGANGSGKSSFVDAVEYAIKAGKIGHLTHEYSGKRQEKGIRNTHTPVGSASELRIKFNDDSELKVEVDQIGAQTRSGAEAIGIESWDYRRMVLRQDEVGQFMLDTKGG